MTEKAQLTPVGGILIYGLFRVLPVGQSATGRSEHSALFGRVTGKQ